MTLFDVEATTRVITTGIFSGIGSAIGGYLATKIAIQKIERHVRRIRRRR